MRIGESRNARGGKSVIISMDDARHPLVGPIYGTIFSTMKLAEDIKPVTYMKSRAAELLKTVGETRRPVVITQNGEPKGVLLDITSYQELRDAVLLLKLAAQGEADVQAGRTVPQGEVFQGLRDRLAES